MGSGVSLQPPTPLHIMRQKRCFWIPRMGVFETQDAKNIVWVLGWRSKRPYHCTPQASKGVFGYLEWWCLNCTMPKHIVRVLGWRPKHPYLCTPSARKGVFVHLVWGCLKCAYQKMWGFWRGAPSAHTSAPNLTERVVLYT